MATHILETVITQGRSTITSPNVNYVRWYRISYGQDGISWVHLPKRYKGNVDKDTKNINSLPENTQARFIRLRPTGWKGIQALRFDVTGCPVPSE